MTSNQDFYKLPKIYDIGFDFRDIVAECDFLENVFQNVLGRSVHSVLEIAAGPARHMLEFSHRGVKSTALDLSPEMVEYGKKLASESGTFFRYECADMKSFFLEDKFELAVILMDSTAYLLDNEAVLAHLESVANHLADNGLYILEMTHPRDSFGVGKSTVSEWTSERDGIEVKIKWGREDDLFDPISQITLVNVEVEQIFGEETEKFFYCAEQRCFTANEFKALVQASGLFKWIKTFGALDTSIPFDNHESSWRMVPVLQKI